MQPNRCPPEDKEECLCRLLPSVTSISEMFRSYLGNKCTTKVFPFFCGVDLISTPRLQIIARL